MQFFGPTSGVVRDKLAPFRVVSTYCCVFGGTWAGLPETGVLWTKGRALSTNNGWLRPSSRWSRPRWGRFGHTWGRLGQIWACFDAQSKSRAARFLGMQAVFSQRRSNSGQRRQVLAESGPMSVGGKFPPMSANFVPKSTKRWPTLARFRPRGTSTANCEERLRPLTLSGHILTPHKVPPLTPLRASAFLTPQGANCRIFLERLSPLGGSAQNVLSIVSAGVSQGSGASLCSGCLGGSSPLQHVDRRGRP